MNEKRNDHQKGGTGRDRGVQRDPQERGRRDQNPEQDRTRTGQVGGEDREDTARQGQRGSQKSGIGQQKPGRDMQEDVE